MGTYFFLALVLSFLGSIPIGIISLTIIQVTIAKGRSSGLAVALGATIMEYVYTFIGIASLDFLSENDFIVRYMQIFSVFLFLGMGIYYILKKNKEADLDIQTYSYLDFFHGVAVGFMNLLIVPFWIFLGLWLESNEWVLNDYTIINIFSLGSAIGALMMFGLYILISERIAKKINVIKEHTNKAVGILFVGLAIFQLIQLI